ncbi:MAG: hypothetical protein GKS05_10830 [Nitrospirales bacterium]|nr:hypothetical protein [Nitrospirales bacterium]
MAVDASSDLGTLLRKCQLFAARLGNQPLENWLIWELNGYPPNVEVPGYRSWSLEFKGHFSGPRGSKLENAPIPITCIPNNVRHLLEPYICRKSITHLDECLKKRDRDVVRVETGDLALYLGMKVYRHHNCVEAWAEYSTGHVVALLNTVRNRILDFTLAIWKAEPTIDDSNVAEGSKLKPAQVTQIVKTTIYGGVTNVLDTTSNTNVGDNIKMNDVSSLQNMFREHGVSDNDIQDLKDALELDDTPDSAERFGQKTSAWIGTMMQKAADGSWAIGIGQAGNLLAQALARFYGFSRTDGD